MSLISQTSSARYHAGFSPLSIHADSFGKTWYRLENPDKHQ